jgi:hypothetical protein
MKKSIYLFMLMGILLITDSAVANISVANTISEIVAGKQDGLSYETAVVIKEKTEAKGVPAEYKWLAKHYPGYKLEHQSLMTDRDKPYDLMAIVLADGSRLTIYFDISHYFGKL